MNIYVCDHSKGPLQWAMLLVSTAKSEVSLREEIEFIRVSQYLWSHMCTQTVRRDRERGSE